MPLYRFYQILSDNGPLHYIGSTRQTLRRRYSDHVSAYRRGIHVCSVKALFDTYGVENCRMVTLQETECEGGDDVRIIERRLQDQHREHLVNIRRAHITLDEYKELTSRTCRNYNKRLDSIKQERLTPEEYAIWKEHRRVQGVEAQRRYRQRVKPSKLLSLQLTDGAHCLQSTDRVYPDSL
jgi:hypothetical protein